MQVHQVIRCSGQWEDYHESVLGTYIDQTKAEEEKAKQVERIDSHINEYEKCIGCCNDRPCFSPDEVGDCCNETWFDDELYEARIVIKSFDVIE